MTQLTERQYNEYQDSYQRVQIAKAELEGLRTLCQSTLQEVRNTTIGSTSEKIAAIRAARAPFDQQIEAKEGEILHLQAWFDAAWYVCEMATWPQVEEEVEA